MFPLPSKRAGQCFIHSPFFVVVKHRLQILLTIPLFFFSIKLQIRNEYQKYVRNSWLPQCLQCESIVNEDQGPTASPTNNALSANVLLPVSNTSTKKKTPADVNDVTGTFLGSPAHQAHGQTSTLMRHHQSQRHNIVGTYTGTLRENRTGGPSKYMTNVGIHKYQPYNFQNAEMIYPQAAVPQQQQQFHQMGTFSRDLSISISTSNNHIYQIDA